MAVQQHCPCPRGARGTEKLLSSPGGGIPNLPSRLPYNVGINESRERVTKTSCAWGPWLPEKLTIAEVTSGAEQSCLYFMRCLVHCARGLAPALPLGDCDRERGSSRDADLCLVQKDPRSFFATLQLFSSLYTAFSPSQLPEAHQSSSSMELGTNLSAVRRAEAPISGRAGPKRAPG